MPVRPLPSRPNLIQLRYQAKDLLREHALRSPSAAQRIREFHPRFQSATDAEVFGAEFALSDAQLAIAREHGFASWTRLKRHIENPAIADRLDLPHHQRIEDAAFRRAVELVDAGDVSNLRAHLRQNPNLVSQRVLFEGGNYFRNPSLLEFIAENPVRRGTLPENIVQITELLIDAGADQQALDEIIALVATGRVPRECRVQIPLINLLCDRGANADAALQAAVLHGEGQAADALIGRGARIDLAVSAGLGRIEDARRLLPAADDRMRHLALASASQYGHVEIVRLFLDAGEDPDRYNPVGSHSHSTPLHEAAGGGHFEVVRLLVEQGARLDQKDILWRGTPADWAAHEGKTAVEQYLRAVKRERQAGAD